MNSGKEEKIGLKGKLIHEMKEMLVIFLYLALFFCSFSTYRRLIMHEMGIGYLHFGFALFNALVLAKVILLGQYVRFSKLFDDHPFFAFCEIARVLGEGRLFELLFHRRPTNSSTDLLHL